jgi:hypothetical protein
MRCSLLIFAIYYLQCRKTLYWHEMSDYIWGLDWYLHLSDIFTACDYTSHITVTHRLMFSVTLLGSSFQRRKFLCFRVCGHLTPTSYSDRWSQPVVPIPASFRAGLTSNCQHPTSAVNSRLASDLNLLPSAAWVWVVHATDGQSASLF